MKSGDYSKQKSLSGQEHETRGVVNLILRPVAKVFRLGVAIRHVAYQSGWLKTRRLNRPVVSVGNLTVGGTGKTPLVALIARILLDHGWTPAILTRGYGRRGSGVLAIEPGSARRVDARRVGDEPALLAKALPELPLVIAADRYRAGRLAEERFHVDVHLLDDGFQHLALARNLDIVLADSTQELSDGALLPAGRLREPCSALRRADWVVLTRAELGDPLSLETRIRGAHPRLRIFHSSTKLARFVDIRNSSPWPEDSLRDKLISAFCGIGNPVAFFADLRRWGFHVITEKAFPDHHLYNAAEIHDLLDRSRRAGAAAVVTTEKDTMNFPQGFDPDFPILACAVQTEIVEAHEFEQALLKFLEATKKEGTWDPKRVC
jgi:tetraacyldisaccharide 4'-kinase